VCVCVCVCVCWSRLWALWKRLNWLRCRLEGRTRVHPNNHTTICKNYIWLTDWMILAWQRSSMMWAIKPLHNFTVHAPFLFFFLSRLFFMYWLLVYVALGAASIVEPHGFSVMIFLCVVNSVSLFRRIKMFCSVCCNLLFCNILAIDALPNRWSRLQPIGPVTVDQNRIDFILKNLQLSFLKSVPKDRKNASSQRNKKITVKIH